MRSFRECPSCRALLTEEQLATSGGTCPYCDHRLPTNGGSSGGADRGPDNPYAPPLAVTGDQVESLTVPRGLGGKIAMAAVLLAEQLPLFAALVLTIWVPGRYAHRDGRRRRAQSTRSH